jgi:hypothetical protein
MSPKIELIAVLNGFANPKLERSTDFEESEIEEEFKSRTIYTFYHVMWIEWENGIAYRKAIGRVYQDTWERQN